MLAASQSTKGMLPLKNVDQIIKGCVMCALTKSKRLPHNTERMAPTRKFQIAAIDNLDPMG